MTRLAIRTLGLALAASATLTLGAQQPPADTSLVQRFLTHQTEPVVRYRATRRLEAENKRFNVKGWMEVATELSPEGGFTWTVIEEGGSGYIRNKVLRKTLEGEAQAVKNNDPAKAALTETNYTFATTSSKLPKGARTSKENDEEDGPAVEGGPDLSAEAPAKAEDAALHAGDGATADGRARLFITPKRKDLLLVDGAVVFSPVDGDLIQVEGRLSKTPSWWTRSVDIVRRYARVGGIRVPVVTESTANVRIAGRSAFKMTYTYQTINGRDVAADGR